jgi:polysaccharide pyruvyl transferase WcaK-like protein
VFYNRPQYASKFNFNLNYKQYKQLEVPKIFYGIGINSQIRSTTRWIITSETKKSIKSFANITNFIGVRDHSTVNFLKELGIRNVNLVPCPSSLLLYKMDYPKRNRSAAINLTTRGGDIKTLRLLLNMTILFFMKFKIHPILVSHNPREDKKCIKLANEFGIEYFIPSSPENLMAFYKKQRFLVGMRGHSLIYATGAGLPMIALSYNEKCDAHMQLIGMEEYIVPKTQFMNEKLITEKLSSLLDQEKDLRSKLFKITDQFYEMNLNFVKKFVNTF